MLSKYMESNEYFKDIEAAVDENPEYKEKERIYLDALKALKEEYGFDNMVYDSIDNPATGIMVAARELAYKKGFQDGVLLVAKCMSARRNNTEKGMDYNQALKREDYRQAWDMKSNTHNKLMDLLIDHGVDLDIAMKAVEAYGDGLEAYTLISSRMEIPEAI